MLSCRLTSAPLWLGIYLFLWWFLLVIFGLFLLHWRYELPCQDKLPEFQSTPILGCIRILWLVSHPLGLRLDKVLCGWNSVTFYWIQSAYNLSDMLSKHWDHPTVYPMILKLLITRGNITLIPKEATQEKEKENLELQPERLKKKEKEE